jgi:hypothetical protein
MNQTLLPIVLLLISDSYYVPQLCRALLDSGAQETLITESCIQKLGLRRDHAKFPITGLNKFKANTTRGKAALNLYCEQDYLQSTNDIYRSIKLADPSFHQPNKIHLLLSCDVMFAMIKNGKIQCGNVIAQNTTFGWVKGEHNYRQHNQPSQHCRH